MRLFDPITRANTYVEGQIFFNRLSNLLFDLQAASDRTPQIKRSWLKSARDDMRISLLLDSYTGKMERNGNDVPLLDPYLSDWGRRDLRMSERCLSGFLKASRSPRITIFY